MELNRESPHLFIYYLVVVIAHLKRIYILEIICYKMYNTLTMVSQRKKH
jgi:hypothetical protein